MTPGNTIVPWTCTACGIRFAETRGGICAACGRVPCMSVVGRDGRRAGGAALRCLPLHGCGEKPILLEGDQTCNQAASYLHAAPDRGSALRWVVPCHRGDLVQETRALDSRASGVALPLRSQVLLYALARHGYPLSSVTIILRRRASLTSSVPPTTLASRL